MRVTKVDVSLYIFDTKKKYIFSPESAMIVPYIPNIATLSYNDWEEINTLEAYSIPRSVYISPNPGEIHTTYFDDPRNTIYTLWYYNDHFDEAAELFVKKFMMDNQ